MHMAQRKPRRVRFCVAGDVAKSSVKENKTGAIDLTFEPQILMCVAALTRRSAILPQSAAARQRPVQIQRPMVRREASRGHGLPSGVLGRIGVSVSAARSNRVYAIIEAEKGRHLPERGRRRTWQLSIPIIALRSARGIFHHVFAYPKSVDTSLCAEHGGLPFHRWRAHFQLCALSSRR